MCGIVGIINNKEKIDKQKKVLINMIKTLKYRGPDAKGHYISDHLLFGHTRLEIVDLDTGAQPMKYENYTIVYNGELYNADSIKKKLIKKGITFDTTSDTEVVLKAYTVYKEKILDILEGIYAFAIYDGKDLILVRDRLGVKPLFYTKVDDTLIFASEIKALLKHPLVKAVINIDSLRELLAVGPSRSPGNGIFKDIYELKGGHYLTYKEDELTIKRYWNVKDEEFNDDFKTVKKKIRKLVIDSVKSQMVSDVPISCFLSGGLDSSIITGIVATELRKKNKQLTTYSVDYKDNSKYFKENDYQVSQDNYYINIMKEKFNTDHHYIVINEKELAASLKEALLARDIPGMSDIDSSLYLFSKEIAKKNKVILSGEVADEVFGGYPWFYKPELLSLTGFPWLRNIEERNELLNDSIKEKLNIVEYMNKKYNETIMEIPKCSNEKEKKKKELFYINMIWIMPTLLDRKDRMTMRCGLEARIPFGNQQLVEYLWNIPWEYKYYNNMEKGLLREAFKDFLPKEITYRKKNPYPKTHNPKYEKIVTKLLKKRLQNKDSVLYKIFNVQKLNELMDSCEPMINPWFGQLMNKPQLIAYLYQFDLWFDLYDIELII